MTNARPQEAACFCRLSAAAGPPAAFTYPFCYTPHPLARLAAAQLQARIAGVEEWRDEVERGKMFGVLVVEWQGMTGYLSAFSGLLMGRNTLPGFVPPVFDTLNPGDDFLNGVKQVEQLSEAIRRSEQDERRTTLMARLHELRRQAETEEADRHRLMLEARTERRRLRSLPDHTTADEAELIRQSQYLKAEYRRLRHRHQAEQAPLQQELQGLDEQTDRLKAERRRLSDELQTLLFSRFSLLNARGEARGLIDIFRSTVGMAPPSGAGECCAPKLLQYAYLHGMRPLCMAEFWWGQSPVGELRRHLQYYPACSGKCKPILSFMLQGLRVEPNPLAVPTSEPLRVAYEDRYLAVVCKPGGMLSVPGKEGLPSVVSYMACRWHIDPGTSVGEEQLRNMVVHRLDMDTSGLMIVARTAAVGRLLRQDFAAGRVKKQYRAVVETGAEAGSRDDLPQRGVPTPTPSDVGRLTVGSRGHIALPLSPDYLHRPLQRVDLSDGKAALTDYEVVSVDGPRATLLLTPHTGRTHQLRVHCASPLGLNAPIVGDRLYGLAPPASDGAVPDNPTSAEPLRLHAETLSFVHPVTHQRLTLHWPAPK